jgi:hypothetical protein
MAEKLDTFNVGAVLAHGVRAGVYLAYASSPPTLFVRRLLCDYSTSSASGE